MSSHPNPLRGQRQGDGRIVPLSERQTLGGTYSSLSPARQPRELAVIPSRGFRVPARQSRGLPAAPLQGLSPIPISSQEPATPLAPSRAPPTATPQVTSTSARKTRALPAALSLTLVGTNEPSQLQVDSTQLQPTLPHVPFEDLLPDSIPKPESITGKSLQEVMLLRGNTPVWRRVRATIRKHMTALEVTTKEKHLALGKPEAEWISPWGVSRNPPADLVSMLCALVRRDPSTRFMQKYEGDWGTREVMKSCCKYHMKGAIATGKRPPRANYPHAARNSAKRDPNGLRGPKYGQAASRRARNADSLIDTAADSNPLLTIGNLHSTTERTAHLQLAPSNDIGHWDNQLNGTHDDGFHLLHSHSFQNPTPMGPAPPAESNGRYDPRRD
ncbi:hypothetical protein BJ322DRAFT_99946 [Thelephora terrestris]|uniref:Uncharacterized protein n=1 Tax=Thelephora terrestris TaxID=56493 RepID=A0A9P6LC67_9AGAM|nr:hypothetical protein BJ322DRAFT_99946 [Thelephora terrestris]